MKRADPDDCNIEVLLEEKVENTDSEGNNSDTYSIKRESELYIPLTRYKYTKDLAIAMAQYAQAHTALVTSRKHKIPLGTIKKWLCKYNKHGSVAFDDFNNKKRKSPRRPPYKSPLDAIITPKNIRVARKPRRRAPPDNILEDLDIGIIPVKDTVELSSPSPENSHEMATETLIDTMGEIGDTNNANNNTNNTYNNTYNTEYRAGEESPMEIQEVIPIDIDPNPNPQETFNMNDMETEAQGSPPALDSLLPPPSLTTSTSCPHPNPPPPACPPHTQGIQGGDGLNLNEEELQEWGGITASHIRVKARDSKLPKVAGWEKVNLISPTLRLWAAKEGAKNGCRLTAQEIGVNPSTIRAWVTAYQTMGEEAHIFKTNVNRYKGPQNGGRGKGICIFSLEFKKQIIDQSLRENHIKVAFENGISPGTIRKWKKALNYPKQLNEENEFPLPYWYYKSPQQARPFVVDEEAGEGGLGEGSSRESVGVGSRRRERRGNGRKGVGGSEKGGERESMGWGICKRERSRGRYSLAKAGS